MRPVYGDERSWIPVADGLKRRGWTVITARDEAMLGTPDREQLAHATEEDWLRLTVDDDVLALVEGEGLSHAGRIFVRRAGRRIGDVVKVVDTQLAERDEDDRGIHDR